MPNKNRLLFFVDHKYRDLKSLSLISFFLRKKGYETKLTALWNFEEIKKFNPKFIIFNKPHMFDREKIKNVLENRYNLCITTEGQAHFRQPIVNFPCDLNFFWNKYSYDVYSEIPNHKKKIIGCQRTDYLDKKIITYQNRKIDLNYKCLLRKKRKNITFAIPDTSTRFKGKKLIRYCNYVDKTHFNVKSKFFDYIKHHREANENLKKYLIFFSKKYQNLNFIIKPHPNDDHKYWIKLSRKQKNIKVLYGIDISDFLKLSSLHITVEGCNTTFESIYNKINTAEIKLNKTFSKLDMSEITLELCRYKIFNFDDLKNIIHKVFVKKKKLLTDKSKLDKYIKFHYYKIDNLRCKKYADTINKFIKIKNEEYYLQRVSSLFIIFKNKEIFSNLYFILKEVIKKLINYDSTIFKKQKKLKKNNNEKFDSRIADTDDRIYYKYFTKFLNL